MFTPLGSWIEHCVNSGGNCLSAIDASQWHTVPIKVASLPYSRLDSSYTVTVTYRWKKSQDECSGCASDLQCVPDGSRYVLVHSYMYNIIATVFAPSTQHKVEVIILA